MSATFSTNPQSGLSGKEKPNPEEVTAQLERILTSPNFLASRQLTAFLRYVVEESLAGRANKIKGYSIAIDALGRHPDFDPKLDSSVRVQAGRLRRALDNYYQSHGKADQVKIELPKKIYVPLFKWTGDTPEEKRSLTLATHDPENSNPSDKHQTKRFDLYGFSSILIILLFLAIALHYFRTGTSDVLKLPEGPIVTVLPFDNLSGNRERDFFVHGLAEELSINLSRFQDLSVIVYSSARSFHEQGGDIDTIRQKLGVQYVITGSLRENGHSVRITAKLIDTKTKQQLWAESYNRELTTADLFDIQDDISESIVGVIGGEYGVISRSMASASKGKRDTSLTVFEAISRFRQYSYEFSLVNYEEALQGLEQAVVIDPQNSLAWAMLGTLYIDAYALAVSPIDSALEKGTEYIRKAILLDPQNQYARSMQGFIYQLSGDREAALRAYEETIKLNPAEGFLVGASGWHMALVGEFERGLAVMEKGMKLNPYYPGYFHFAYYLNFFRQGKYERALAEADKLNMPDLFWDPLLYAAALGQLGRDVEARAAYKKTVQLRPDFPERARFYISRYVMPEELVEEMLSGLYKAGLPQSS